MKTNFLILSLIIISNLVFGQIPKNAIAFEDKEFNSYFLKKEHIPVVKGKILNLTNNEIKQIKIEYHVVTPFGNLQTQSNCELNTDGTFEFKLDYAFPYQQIWVIVGDLFFAGLYANKELYVELDAHVLKLLKYGALNASGVKYLGKDGALNTYMNNHVLHARKKRFELDKAIQLLKNKTIHIKKYDSLYAVLTELDNEYIKQNPSDFSWLVINERQSQYYKNLCSDNFFKKMPTKLFEKVKKHKAFLTSNDGMMFYQYLFMYLQVQGNVIVEPAIHLKRLDSLFTSSKADFLKIRFSDKDLNKQKKMLETVLPTIKTNWCKTVIQNEYNNTIKELESINKTLGESKTIVSVNPLGQPIAELSSGAKLYKVDTLNVETLLLNLKNLFQNKALLIDFWATWCAGCIEEFPKSKKLHEDTKDLPIEFVYLCTSEGSTFEKWINKIAEFELNGTHIYVDKKIENELMEMFSGSGFPTYVLINTKGEYKPGIERPSHLNKHKLAEWIK
jgi:thiol-disulfide isomerase/thioredoxin